MQRIMVMGVLLMSTQTAHTAVTVYRTRYKHSITLERRQFCDGKLLFEVKACDAACVKIMSNMSTDAIYLQLDNPPVFVSPSPGSALQLEVQEDTPLDTVLYRVEAHDPDDEVTYDVIGEHKNVFQMKGSRLTLQRDMDYEKQNLYSVTVRARGGRQDVNATVLVKVKAVHEPVIHLSTQQMVVEELPLGHVIPGVFTVTEKEQGRGLNYRLHGEHKTYVDINTFTGDLLMVNRLDYENTSCPRVLDNLTLEVENGVGHKSFANLSIKVVNLNDNAPRFSETVYKAKLTEKDDIAKPLVTIRCDDPDRDDHQNITLTVREPDLSGLFRIQRTDTAFALSFQDTEEIAQLGDTVVITLDARDSNTAIVHTATAEVQIDISSVSNFTPSWVSPVGENITSDIIELYVWEDHPLDVPIATFNATWISSNIAYSIESVLTDSNQTVKGVFTIDEHLGYLKAVSPLDCDTKTGGVQFYTISVKAFLPGDANQFSVRRIRLYIDDVDDNAPIFSEAFYFAPSGCNKNDKVTLLTFNLTDYDITSNTTFIMAENASKYTMLDSENGSIILMPSPNGTVQRWDTFELFTVTAYDINDARLNSTVHVMVYYDNCSPGAQRRRRLRAQGFLILPTPRKPCETKKYVKDKSVEDYIFKATSGILGLILVCIAAFYLSKRTVFKTSSPSVNPLEEEQDGEEEEQKNNGEGERRVNVIYVGPKRDEKSRQRSGSELTAIRE